MFLNSDKYKKGIALYLAIVITAIVLAIALGLSAIIWGQLRMIREMGHSVVAFYAADAGIEKVLKKWEDVDEMIDLFHEEDFDLDNEAVYKLFILKGDTGGCPADMEVCIKSIGTYKGTRRAIEVNY